MIFFTADTHFCDSLNMDEIGHIKRDGRPFKSVKQMDKFILKNFNKVAKKDDIIYCVGDFFNYNSYDLTSYEKGLKMLKKIKAKVVIILGNQETRLMRDRFDNNFEKLKEYFLNAGFYDVIEEGLILESTDKENNKFNIYLNHYPSKTKPDCFNLFGHIHNRVFVKKYGINVGVDCNHFRLFSLDDVINFKHLIEYELDEEVFY